MRRLSAMRDGKATRQVRKGSRSRTSHHQTAVVAILRASAVIGRRVGGVLGGYGLTPSQYNVLRIVRGSPDGLATMEIRSRLLDQEPGITRLIDGLERMGFLKRVRSQDDRRRIDCKITAAGSKVLGSLDEPIDTLDRAVLRRLSISEMKQLNSLLSCIEEAG